jgi:Fur family transcriptional regulator, zinc uptake regulator
MPDTHHNHAACTANLIDRAEKLCSLRGTKLTGQRKVILQSVAESHSAVGAYEIIERMASNGVRPAPITVYRALDFLLDHDLVHKVESRNAFVACAGNHADCPPILLVCEKCGMVNEVTEPQSNAALKKTADEHSFAIKKIVMEITGLCEACAG